MIGGEGRGRSGAAFPAEPLESTSVELFKLYIDALAFTYHICKMF